MSQSTKTCTKKNLFILPVLLAGLGFIQAGRVTGQIFTVLHSFKGSDGANPFAGLVLSGNTLYGTTRAGGNPGYGTVFAINTDGTGFTNLHEFTGGNDGAETDADLVLSGSTLYGTATSGGISGAGTIFRVDIDGSRFTILHSFDPISILFPTNSGGAFPHSGLVLSGNTLYGTAFNGGPFARGTVFKVNTDGTAFSTLHNFSGSDSSYPLGRLILSGTTLYGTVKEMYSANGSIFKLESDGTGYRTLYSFSANPFRTNSDGALPLAGVILHNNILYGTTGSGGSEGFGTVFAVSTNGTGFTTLHNFTYSDGAYPQGPLILSSNMLYGTTSAGGAYAGTVFRMTTIGTDFVTLHKFVFGQGAAEPWAGLVSLDHMLFGTTIGGGLDDSYGTVFRLSFPPFLSSIAAGPNLVLSWPTNYTGYTLQSATNLVSPVWTANSSVPFVINGQNVFTNPISGTQQFFKLNQ